MIKIRVPATSANVGAGFDSLGLAVTLYNELHIDDYDGVLVESLDGTAIPTGESNLVVRSMKQLYERCGRPFGGVRLGQVSPIPLSRGLGSSSACIVGGLLGANILLGEPFSQGELIDIATEIEGHPDNVTPAFLGGFVTSVFADGHVHCIKQEIADDLRFVAAVPDMKLKTVMARGVLPESVSRADCVYNLSRASLMSAAMHSRRYEMLRAASGDRLHQPFRLELIPGGADMMSFMEAEGAYCSFISGAGSTIMAIVPAGDTGFAERLGAKAAACGWDNYRIFTYRADNIGATQIFE